MDLGGSWAQFPPLESEHGEFVSLAHPVASVHTYQSERGTPLSTHGSMESQETDEGPGALGSHEGGPWSGCLQWLCV